MKISFCTTCKNRLYQLEQTIFKNLNNIKNDGNSELILIDYNDTTGLDNFIDNNFRKEINDGILTYIKEYNSKYFEVSKAKNLSHFAANGNFLFNLDADNFINNEIYHFRNIWNKYPNTLIHGDRAIKNDGSYGRIGISREIFNNLGGYDEDIGTYYEDTDLIDRCLKIGLLYAKVIDKNSVSIRNSVGDTLINTEYSNLTQRECYNKNKQISADKLNKEEIRRNINRQKVKVIKNFNQEIEI